MSSTFATTMDVSTELGRPLATAEEGQADRWIGQAERLIRGRIPDLDARVTIDGPLSFELVGDIIVAAVVRKIRNPEGFRVVMSSVDDASIQKTVDSSQSDGALRILPDEWARLLGDGGAFSVRPTYTPSADVVDRWPF